MSENTMSEPVFKAPELMKNKLAELHEMNKTLVCNVGNLIQEFTAVCRHAETITDQFAKKNREIKQLKQDLDKYMALNPQKKTKEEYDDEEKEDKMEDRGMVKRQADLSKEQLDKLEDIFQKKLELTEVLAKSVGVDFLVLAIWIRLRQSKEDLDNQLVVMADEYKRLSYLLEQASAPSAQMSESRGRLDSTPCQGEIKSLGDELEKIEKHNEGSSLEYNKDRKQIAVLEEMVERRNVLLDGQYARLEKFRERDDAEIQKSTKDYFDLPFDEMIDGTDPEMIKIKWQQNNPLIAIVHLEGDLLQRKIHNVLVTEEFKEAKEKLDAVLTSPDEFQAQTLEFQETVRRQAEAVQKMKKLKLKLDYAESKIKKDYEPTIQKQETELHEKYLNSRRIGVLRQKDLDALKEERTIAELFRKAQRERDAAVENYKKMAEEQKHDDPSLKKIAELNAQLEEKTEKISKLKEMNDGLKNRVNDLMEEQEQCVGFDTEAQLLRERLEEMRQLHRQLKERNEQLEAEAEEYEDGEMEEDP